MAVSQDVRAAYSDGRPNGGLIRLAPSKTLAGAEVHLLLLQVDHDLGRPQRHLLHKVQVLVPAHINRVAITASRG